MRQILGFIIMTASSFGWTQIRSRMTFFNDSFLSTSYESTAARQFQFLGLHLKNGEAQSEYFQIDMEGAVAMGAPLLSYIKIDEIYFQVPTFSGQKLSLGRHKVLWSQLDHRWNFGVWQPVFKVNPLSPQSQGLTGLFWEFENDWSALSFFASPFYLPNQGASFDIDSNGQFVKGNPWFSRPPEMVRIHGENSMVEYSIDKSNQSQLFYQSSYSARFQLKNELGSFVQLSYGFKPMNGLALAYDAIKDIPKDRVAVAIQPHVYYHSVTGADLSWSKNWFHLGVSGLIEKPQKTSAIDERWNYPVMEEAQIYSGFIDIDFKYVLLSLERIQIFNGEVRDEGELSLDHQRSITSRFLFTEANRLSMSHNYFLKKNRKLNTAFMWTQSQKNGFQILQTKSQFVFSKLWSVYADLQLISAAEPDKNNQSEIYKYASNDRLSLGVNYVF